MKQVRTVEDVYPAIDELVIELNLAGHSKLGASLYHRMYQVAWTSRSELSKELQNVLTKCATSEGLPEFLRSQMMKVLEVMEFYLASRD